MQVATYLDKLITESVFKIVAGMEICSQTYLRNRLQIKKESFGWPGEEYKYICINTFML